MHSSPVEAKHSKQTCQTRCISQSCIARDPAIDQQNPLSQHTATEMSKTKLTEGSVLSGTLVSG